MITRVNSTSNPFDSPLIIDIYYDYHLDFIPSHKGGDKNIDIVLHGGDPIVVLVHKDDIEVSFFGRFGIIDERLRIDNQDWK